jgi:hypothetical protein
MGHVDLWLLRGCFAPLCGLYARELERLCGLPTILKANGMTFVHGAICEKDGVTGLYKGRYEAVE